MVWFCSSEIQEQGSVVGQILKTGVLTGFPTDSSSEMCQCNWFDNYFGSLSGFPKSVARCLASEDRRIAPSKVRGQLRKSERLLLPAPPHFSPVLVLHLSAGDSSWEDSLRRAGTWGHSKEGKQKGCLLNSTPALILYLSNPASAAPLMFLEFLASGICQKYFMPSGTHCKNVIFCLHQPCNCRYSYGS